MITKQIRLYSIGELQPKLKKKALNEYRNIYTDYDTVWCDFIQHEYRERLNKLGYREVELWYSGFGSQGDGACFDAKVYATEWLEAHKLKTKYKALYAFNADNPEHMDFKHTGRYYHEFSIDTIGSYLDSGEPSDTVRAQVVEVESLIEAERVKLCKELYRELQDEYMHLTSDEVVEDALQVNEYLFLEDGTKYNGK